MQNTSQNLNVENLLNEIKNHGTKSKKPFTTKTQQSKVTIKSSPQLDSGGGGGTQGVGV